MTNKKDFESPVRVTEERNPLTENIDTLSSLDIVEIIHREDQKISDSIWGARSSIARTIDWCTKAVGQGGRVFYIGAGTSGRLGVLDAAEVPPTFGMSPEVFQGLIAGGEKALTSSIEGAEDGEKDGAQMLLSRSPTKMDIVIGISAASTTPFVHGALRAAKKVEARTVLVTSNSFMDQHDEIDLVISLVTGPEVITGSTRMKAGTATKMVLNMISTGTMIRLGRTYGNLMVDLQCNNDKLRRRGIRTIQSLTQMTDAEASHLLNSADGHVKTALAMNILKTSRAEANRTLHEKGGFLRRLFDHVHQKNPEIDTVIFDMDGTILEYNLPTGFSTWAALGWAYGIFQEMEDWVEQYQKGKISYEEIWGRCAKSIEGKSYLDVQDCLFPVVGRPPYSRGFINCIETLQRHYTIGIVSSGISTVANEVQKELNLDFAISNELVSQDGIFTGKAKVHVPFDQKFRVIQELAREKDLDLTRVCFVGDSHNDVETFRNVRLPIAYRPKTDEVAAAAGRRVIGDFLQLPQVIERFEA